MADLVIRGNQESQQRRTRLDENRVMVLGRSERADVAVPWDLLISRRHAEIQWVGEKLHVRKLETGRNAISFRNSEYQEFEMSPGEEFQIGQTWFRFESSPETADRAGPEDSGLEMLSGGEFQNAGRWLEVLSRLPDSISRSGSDEEFAQGIVKMMLETLPRVNAAAVLDLMGLIDGVPSQVRRLCWDVREPGITHFQISRSLVAKCFQRQESLIHIWGSDESPSSDGSGVQFTNTGQFDWTFCVPIAQSGNVGWCLYLSGFLDCENMPVVQGRKELHEELRFVELLAQFIGALRELRLLENRKEGWKQFFSPAIRENVLNAGGETVLRPRESDISVLFSQFRATAAARKAASSGLADLSAIVDASFRVMSESLFAENGVMADFQGESSLAFWGWPLPTNDGPLPACRAALSLKRAQFQSDVLAKTRLVCGIAHGPGLAGKIGPEDQCKMGVFGHVVNLGARLKGMARHLKSAILIDAATAKFVREQFSPSEGRCRKIGTFRPQGMDEAVTVHELLLPAGEASGISDQHLADFEGAVDLISCGEWEQATKLLHSLPADDACKHFLILMIAFYNYAPPPRWDGVFSLLSK